MDLRSLSLSLARALFLRIVAHQRKNVEIIQFFAAFDRGSAKSVDYFRGFSTIFAGVRRLLVAGWLGPFSCRVPRTRFARTLRWVLRMADGTAERVWCHCGAISCFNCCGHCRTIVVPLPSIRLQRCGQAHVDAPHIACHYCRHHCTRVVVVAVNQSGPNGAGKSTLMRIISGELIASSGDVRFGGQSVKTTAGQAARARRLYVWRSMPHMVQGQWLISH